MSSIGNVLHRSTALDCPLDPAALRQAFGTFVTGITVITTLEADGTPRGMTANSFTSVSLDPALVLVCIGKNASSYAAFASAEQFAVNVLHKGQTGISGVFASKALNKFESIDYRTVHTGAPVLSHCLTWFDCTVQQRVDAGDHLILIGQIHAFDAGVEAPLVFSRGRYAQLQEDCNANHG